jgi:hypothetical protein
MEGTRHAQLDGSRLEHCKVDALASFKLQAWLRL